MLTNIFYSQLSPQTKFLYMAALLLAAVIAIVLHELAHGYMAKWQGDYTAKMAGRLTLNPVKHFDLLGFLMMCIAGIGWAKPVPVNPAYFKKQRRGIFLVSIAGILMNLIIAIVAFVLLVLLVNFVSFGSIFYTFFYAFLNFSVTMNIALIAFNLLPIYPLDGFRIIESFTRYDNKYCRFMRKNGFYVFIALILLGFVATFLNLPWLDVLHLYTNFIQDGIYKLLNLIVGIF